MTKIILSLISVLVISSCSSVDVQGSRCDQSLYWSTVGNKVVDRSISKPNSPIYYSMKRSIVGLSGSASHFDDMDFKRYDTCTKIYSRLTGNSENVITKKATQYFKEDDLSSAILLSGSKKELLPNRFELLFDSEKSKDFIATAFVECESPWVIEKKIGAEKKSNILEPKGVCRFESDFNKLTLENKKVVEVSLRGKYERLPDNLNNFMLITIEDYRFKNPDQPN